MQRRAEQRVEQAAKEAGDEAERQQQPLRLRGLALWVVVVGGFGLVGVCVWEGRSRRVRVCVCVCVRGTGRETRARIQT